MREAFLHHFLIIFVTFVICCAVKWESVVDLFLQESLLLLTVGFIDWTTIFVWVVTSEAVYRLDYITLVGWWNYSVWYYLFILFLVRDFETMFGPCLRRILHWVWMTVVLNSLHKGCWNPTDCWGSSCYWNAPRPLRWHLHFSLQALLDLLLACFLQVSFCLMSCWDRYIKSTLALGWLGSYMLFTEVSRLTQCVIIIFSLWKVSVCE